MAWLMMGRLPIEVPATLSPATGVLATTWTRTCSSSVAEEAARMLRVEEEERARTTCWRLMRMGLRCLVLFLMFLDLWSLMLLLQGIGVGL